MSDGNSSGKSEDSVRDESSHQIERENLIRSTSKFIVQGKKDYPRRLSIIVMIY